MTVRVASEAFLKSCSHATSIRSRRDHTRTVQGRPGAQDLVRSRDRVTKSGPREAGASEGRDQERQYAHLVGKTVPIRRDRLAESVADILDSPEIAQLIAELEGLRWTGRKGYPTRALVGACLTKSLYAIPAWSRHRPR